MGFIGNDKNVISSSYLFTQLQALYTKIKGLIDNKADIDHTHNYLSQDGGKITCDSNNSTYGDAALNIWNATAKASSIYPAISFLQTNICDANIVMMNRQFYRKTSNNSSYFKIYDEETFDRIQSGTTELVDGVSELKNNYIYIQYE